MGDEDHLYASTARLALPHFGLPGDSELTLLASGHNHVFRVDHDARRFVLRFQPVERLSDAAQVLQLTWLRSIRDDGGLCVPCPIAASTGEWFVRMAVGCDLRRCVLLEWVEGKPLSPPGAFVTRAILERVGEVVAEMHQHSSAFRCAGDHSASEINADQLVGSRSSLGDGTVQRLVAGDDHAVLIVAANKVANAMARVRQVEGAYGLIHADLAPANWVFHNGQPRPIDFDEFGRGFYLYDLLGVLWSHASWDEYPTFKANLLSGYERVRPLRAELKACADLFQAATLFAWVNHGCRLTDDAAKTEFLKWVPSTTRTIARLCQV